MVWVYADRPGISFLFVCCRQCHVLCHEEVRNHGTACRSLEDHPADTADLFAGIPHVLVSLRRKDCGRPPGSEADRDDTHIRCPATDSALLWDRFAAGLLFQTPDGDRHIRLPVDRLLDHPAGGRRPWYGPL